MVSRWLNQSEERAWRGFRRTFILLEARLASELTQRTGLSMADYSVLSNLVEAAERTFRITALAEQMQWSQSRLSHQIRRMEERGLVKRQDIKDDARGARVVLTRKGLQAIAQATPIHFAGVRMHMLDLLDDHQVEALADIAETVIAHLTDQSGALADRDRKVAPTPTSVIPR
ncbi:MAG: MarR family winged helix-turn-helix transcriptional regulator [Acidimicrobiia bacterium]